MRPKPFERPGIIRHLTRHRGGRWLRDLVLGALAAASIPVACAGDGSLERIRLPAGFVIEPYADHLPDARTLVFGEGGTLFVSTRKAGAVYALRDTDGDGLPDTRQEIASGLNMPNGVAFRNGDLYIAEVNRILCLKGIEARLARPPAPEVVYEGLPSDRHHGWRTIDFGPQGRLYITIGAPCNVCLREGYGQIRRLDLATGRSEVFARGVRNSVGLAWRPGTGELWFTDNGRDWLGDDLPPDELNRAPRPGLHFGFPYCHGGEVPDPEYGPGHPCTEFTPPALKLPAHVAPLGVVFYTGTQFPARYRGQIFIAEHGSWNRSRKVGYRIGLVHLEGGRVTGYEPFAQGWLENDRAWGRPAYLQVAPDGSLLVSDDRSGAIYRIRYRP